MFHVTVDIHMFNVIAETLTVQILGQLVYEGPNRTYILICCVVSRLLWPWLKFKVGLVLQLR